MCTVRTHVTVTTTICVTSYVAIVMISLPMHIASVLLARLYDGLFLQMQILIQFANHFSCEIL